MKATIEDYMYGRYCIRCDEALDPEDKEGTQCPECGCMLQISISGDFIPQIPLRRKEDKFKTRTLLN